MPADPRHGGLLGPVRRTAGRAGRAVRRRLVDRLGGPTRTRVIVALACVLALSSADTATVGASAIELRRALHINNTDIGLLVAVTAVVGAVFSLPFGVLADRVRRTWTLGFAIVTWGAAMVWSATAGSFGQLLIARLALGATTAAAGPAVASLIGDWFSGGERGQVYSYILTGELVGAGVGFAVTGDVAALSWRAAFVILALPAFGLAWLVFRLPEPARGGGGILAVAGDGQAAGATHQGATRGGEVGGTPDGPGRPGDIGTGSAGAGTGDGSSGVTAGSAPGEGQDEMTDAQRLALARHITPDARLAERAGRVVSFISAVRYVLAVRTNVALIIASACGYYFLAGVQTFGTEFVTGQYRVSQAVANLLLLVVGAGALVGVLGGGPLGDSLLRRGHLSGRVTVAAVALLIPALFTHQAITALPYIFLGAGALSAQNPPIDAARLDIMPSWLWGRAEGIRTFLRTAAQALAPLLFGAVSDYVFGGGHGGLRWTFVVMLLPLSASALFLFSARRRYPGDVATAGVARHPEARPSRGSRAGRRPSGGDRGPGAL